MFKKNFISIISILYFVVLFYLLFLSGYRQSVQGTLDYNLVPFRSISRDFNAIDSIHIGLLTNNLVGNILAFIPFGFLAPLLWRKIHNWVRLFLFSFLITFLIEVLQLLFRIGSFDVDDMILNVLGSLFGFFLKGWLSFRNKD
ncbi:VanZ family protein [Peribacillus deserti]|uniref:VanZ family protein n=1 Tax=Peribacillus deserti TaxID=673318 RepID=A0A2N5M5F1_9BACI|nr:VanZ family protein [Peribacillus deserti]PLT29587.1 VanZ family protein [Peribacillus deserti]